MHNKKYKLDSIKEFGWHNRLYDELTPDAVYYLAYLKPGERGWILWENDSFGMPHRIHTSVIADVEYADRAVIVRTQNTMFTFVEVE